MQAIKDAVAAVNSQFEGFDQQDAGEWFATVIEGLVLETAEKKDMKTRDMGEGILQQSQYWWDRAKQREDSAVNDMFQGQVVNIFEWDTAKHQVYCFDEFVLLHVDIPEDSDQVEIEDWLELTMQQNYFDQQFGFTWSECVSRFLLW